MTCSTTRHRTRQHGTPADCALAPCDGVVLIVSLNPETTVPGRFGPGRSSAMLFRCGAAEDPDVVQVAYVHVREVTVAEGDAVRAGQPVARIGNNGSSYNPHVHIGAYRVRATSTS